MKNAKTKPGYGNCGKTNYVFPPFPQPLLLLTNNEKKAATEKQLRSFTQNPLRFQPLARCALPPPVSCPCSCSCFLLPASCPCFCRLPLPPASCFLPLLLPPASCACFLPLLLPPAPARASCPCRLLPAPASCPCLLPLALRRDVNGPSLNHILLVVVSSVAVNVHADLDLV